MRGAHAISSEPDRRRGQSSRWGFLARAALGMLGLALGASAGPARAALITLPFAVELDAGAAGSYGTLQIDELASGDLAITLALGAALGSGADLQSFSFNLPAGLQAGLAVSGSLCGGGSCATPFVLEAGVPTPGGAGSAFDFRVSFGNGSGPAGNGVLALASFVLGGDAALTIADLLAEHSTTSGGLELNFAAHVQSTATAAGSEAVGVPVPEPGSALLLLLGLGSTGLVRRIGPFRAARAAR